MFMVSFLCLQFQLGPKEYVTKVCGTIGPFHQVSKVITSLTYVTNITSYGCFGVPRGETFVVPDPKQSNSSIVGFFCRAGIALDAIGFYVSRL